MVFTVLAAADIFGAKLNFELDFPARPGLQQLRDRIAQVFGTEAAARRPPECPPDAFAIYRLQMYDERGEAWVDLSAKTVHQMLDYTQVYVFQREGRFHKEVQSKIPPPVKTPVFPVAAALHPVSPAGALAAETAAAEFAAEAAAAAAAAAAAVSPQVRISLSPARDPLSASPCPNPTPLQARPVGASPLLAAAAVAAGSPAGMHAAALVAEHLAGLSAEAEFDDKLRCVFEELDASRCGRITREDWRSAFTRVELGHCQESLFMKADTQRLGSITIDELSAFAQLYPTVLDSLYYRHRDYWLTRKQAAAIEAAERALDSVRDAETDALNALNRATEDSVVCEESLRLQDVEVDAARGRERDALALVSAMAQETERCKTRIDADTTELLACKDRSARAEADMAGARGDVDATAMRQQAAQDDRAAATERLEELLRLVEQQRRLIEEAEVREQSARKEYADAQATFLGATGMLQETTSQLQLCKDRLTVSEEQLLQAQERQRTHHLDHHRACEATAAAVLEKEGRTRAVHVAAEVIQQRRVAHDAAVHSVDVQQRAVQAVRAELTAFETACCAARSQEQQLIEQELRLREARDALDQEEARLRTDHRNFNTSTRAALPSPLHALHAVGTPLP